MPAERAAPNRDIAENLGTPRLIDCGGPAVSQMTRKNVTGRCQLRKDCQNSWLSSHLCNTAVSRSGASKWIR